MSKFLALLFLLLCFPVAVLADTPSAPGTPASAATAQAQTSPPAGAASVQAGIRSAASAGRLQDFCDGQQVGGCVATIVGGLIRVLFNLVGVILIGYLVYAGFLWMTSGGETDKAEDAMKMIRNAIIGLLILASAFAIAEFVFTSLGQVVAPAITKPAGGAETPPSGS